MQLRRNKFSAWKKIEKNAVTIGQTFCMRKRKKNILLMLPNIIQFVKKIIILLSIPNAEGWHCLAVGKVPALLRGITSKQLASFFCNRK